MIAEFDANCDLAGVCSASRSLRYVGAFRKLKKLVFEEKKDIFARVENPTYNPINNEVLLELHCVASATLDALGEYEESRRFVTRWASQTEWSATELLTKSDSELDQIVSKNRELWSCICWFLQRCGVVEYRACRHDHARGFLTTALHLSERLHRREKNGTDDVTDHVEKNRVLTELAAMVAATHYWLACVDMFVDRFNEAEDHYMQGMEILAEDESRNAQRWCDTEDGAQLQVCSPNPAEQLPTYMTARLLLGLGLLNFHRGRLTDAKASVLNASILLSRFSGDRLRFLRSQLLLLSIKRIKTKDKRDLEQIEAAVRALAVDFLGLGHLRYYCRAQWTLGLIRVDMSDLFDGQKKFEDRDRCLNEALQITENYRNVAGESMADQLQMDILKIRILRKLDRTPEAIEWGRFVVGRKATGDQGFLHAESLLALAHAYYRHVEITNDRDSLSDATECIMKAQKVAVSEGNYRSQALCVLHLARVANKLGDHVHAASLLEEWKYLERLVEYDWIRHYALRVKGEIEAGASITMSIDSDSKIYPELHRKLKTFLVNEFANEKNDSAAAAKLGISRQTLAEWRKEFKRMPTLSS